MRGSIFGVCCLIALGLGCTGCTGFEILNAPVCSCGYVRTTNIAYGDQPRQTLDVYRPKGAAPDARVVIFFYGGDWQTGKKADYRFAAAALAGRGFFVVLPDYRLYPQAMFPAFVQDGARVVRWAHDNVSRFGGDPNYLYLMGHSAGAHIAALLTLDGHYLKDVGLNTNVIRATAALAGPYCFDPSPGDRPVFGMGPDDWPNPKIEPMCFVNGHSPPMLVLQGMDDTTVDPREAVRFAHAIQAAGGESRLVEYRCRGHRALVIALDWPFRWVAPVLRDTSDFFYRH
ncbi:MAG TPA: alpha/beta hydrolase [Tepidisphaeraceae bacterium]|nr:alpha/beta hydrolase [Tepidisphaeraceae bacterium]